MENAGELQVFTTKAGSLALKPDDLNKAVQRLGERPMRIKVIVGAAGDVPAEPVAPIAVVPSAAEDEVASARPRQP